MFKLRYRDFKWTVDQIVDVILHHRAAAGFTAESCHGCKKTANISIAHAGWFCVCGAYNVMSWSYHQMPHVRPDLGPSRHILNMAQRQVVHPPNFAKYLWVRPRRPEDRKWNVTMTDSHGTVHRRVGYLYQHEGSPAEMDAWIKKIEDWPQHRDFTLQAVAA